MALHGTNSIARCFFHDVKAWIIVTNSHFFYKSMTWGFMKWDTGLVHVEQVKCVSWKGHSTPAQLALNSASRQHSGKSNLLNSVKILLLSVMSTSCLQSVFFQVLLVSILRFQSSKGVLRLHHICNRVCQY